MKLLAIYNIAAHYRASIYQLMDRELDCDIVAGDRVADIKKMDYSLLRHKVVEVHNLITPHFEFQQGVLRYLRQDYDTYILYSSPRCLSSWLFLIGCKLFYPNKRVFGWTHGMLGKEGRIKQMITKCLFRMLSGAFIYNERSTKLMIERGIPASKLHPIYNSLNYDSQILIRSSLQMSRLYQDHFGNENKNIIFIGRLTEVKRLDLLLNSVSELKNRDEIVNVTLIGDGEERTNLERMVDSLGISEQVWFYGACYDEQTNAELIYNADICVSPGNIGLTAIHVMMFGCPAITNDDLNHQMPEFEAIKEGRTGRFFMKDNSISLADAIREWFSLHEADREQIRNECYEEIDTKWNPHNQIRIFKEVLLNS